MPSTAELATISFIILLSWAAASDVLTQLIPNRISLFIACVFAINATSANWPLTKIATHLACALIVLACGFVLFSRDVIGGGDAKLLSAAALWFGFERLLPFLTLTAIAGGVLAIVYLARNAAGTYFDPAMHPQKTIPYGAAIAVGGLLVIPKYLFVT